jgi:HD-like signal output (HDOD) protein/CheY-like chemotaxis protein
MGKSILFLDNEIDSIKGLDMKFKEKEYAVFISENVDEAMRNLEKSRPSMIVINISIPGINGIQLLKKIKRMYPTILRVIISDDSDENTIFNAFRDNLCKYYLTKPFSNYDIVEIMDDIFELQDVLQAKDLLTTINSLEKLPCLPETYLKVNEMIEDEENLDAISAVIEKDASLTLQLLRIANTAFYNVRTSSLRSVILNLGLNTIKNLILTIGIFDFFSDNSFRKKLLWKHALICNRMVNAIYENVLKIKLPEEGSSAGMLHDVGKIVLFNNYPINYLKIFNKVVDDELTFSESEKEVLAITHNELGAYLLDWWNLPTSVVEVALYHETPFKSLEINRQLVAVVHIASYFAWKGLNIIVNEKLDKKVMEYLKTTNSQCEKILRNILDEIDLGII